MVKWSAVALACLSLSAYGMSDPTLPLSMKQATQTQKSVKRVATLPSLQQITCRDDRACSATLNGQMVKAGQTYRGYRVVNIKEDQVVLSRQNRQWVLDLFGHKIKQ